MFGMTNNSDKIMRKYCRSELEGDITAETVTAFVSSNSLPLVSIIIIIIVILVIKIVILIHHHHHHHFMFKVVEFNTDTAKAIFQGSYNNHLLMFLSKEVAIIIIIIIIIMKIMILKHCSDFILKDAKFEYVLHDARKVGPAFKEKDSQESDVMLASLFCFSSPK